MTKHLHTWDLWLFDRLNGWHTGWSDAVMLFLSDKYVWIPFYLLALWYAYWFWPWQRATLMLVLWVLLITLADQTASGLLKPWIGRYRPCRPEAGLEIVVYTLAGKCGGKYGFVSSHAANFFAMAAFFSGIHRTKWLSAGLFATALAVAYSRIYLGVHYPGDVLGGALVGAFWGWALSQAFFLIDRKFLRNTIR